MNSQGTSINSWKKGHTKWFHSIAGLTLYNQNYAYWWQTRYWQNVGMMPFNFVMIHYGGQHPDFLWNDWLPLFKMIKRYKHSWAEGLQLSLNLFCFVLVYDSNKNARREFCTYYLNWISNELTISGFTRQADFCKICKYSRPHGIEKKN